MKFKIKPFVMSLIRENVVYIIGMIFLLIISIVMTKISLAKIEDADKNIAILEKDVAKLNEEVNFYQTALPTSDKLDQDIALLNRLIPNIEDYFSMIYSLEKLSQDSGFMITGYTVNVNKSTSDKLRLTVSGQGDSSTFLKFLTEYNFGGGRLITSDRIELAPQSTGVINVDLTFYNKSIGNTNNDITLDARIFQDLETIKSKVNFDFSPSTESADLNYPKKSNPF